MLNNLFNRLKEPPVQAVFMLVTILLMMLVCILINAIAKGFVAPMFYWLTATSFLLFYAVANSISSLASDGSLAYWGRSLYSFMGLAAGAGLLAWIFSGISIYDAASCSWLYTVITVVYLVFMSMMRTMKIIVEFAQREEWNSPNVKKRK